MATAIVAIVGSLLGSVLGSALSFLAQNSLANRMHRWGTRQAREILKKPNFYGPPPSSNSSQKGRLPNKPAGSRNRLRMSMHAFGQRSRE